MIPGNLAKRYARALLGLADSPVQRERFGRDLGVAASACAVSFDGAETLGDVLTGAHHALSQRKAVVSEVAHKLAIDPVVERLLALLVTRGRIHGLEQIVRQYAELADLQAGRVRATVRSARPLEPAILLDLKQAFARATGKQVELETEVDPELIGGLQTEIGQYTIDFSVRNTLSNLRQRLKGGAART
ncbi:MAG: ATP synthase F1 subunit delta [Nannocystaceae bacterium]